MRKQNRTRDGEAGHAERRAIMIDRGLRSKRSLPPAALGTTARDKRLGRETKASGPEKHQDSDPRLPPVD